MDLLSLPSHAIVLSGDRLADLEQEALRCAGHWLQVEDPLKHPDCIQLRPLNKMRQIGVDQVRELIRFVAQSSLQGGEKVCIIVEANRLQVSAANALLKTLEEPPSKTRFLLLTTSSEALLPTLKSRAQYVRIQKTSGNASINLWAEWIEAYRNWLLSAFERPKNTQDVANRLMRIYNLLHKVEVILADESNFKINEENSLSDEEKEALEICIKKEAQRDLLRQIGFETKTLFLNSRLTSEDFEDCLNPLNQTLNVLFNCGQLLEVNRSFTAALENFLLQVARLAIF